MSKIITTSVQKYYDTKLKAWVTAADDAVKTEVNGKIGTLGNLATNAKGDLVSAINEVRASVSAGGTAAAISIDTSTVTAGSLKSYTIYQGETKVGVIDIPKDMVVESGTVVDLADGDVSGLSAGTYIKLVLANVADPLYINVGTLVDIYTVQANATQIQLSITDREISATIVDGSVDTDALADNSITTVKIADGNVTEAKIGADAVTTAKIKDGNVTKAKLESSVQTSLDKADSAVQTVEEGSTNGTVKVDGTDVPVHGLGSAAFTESNAYDPAGTGANEASKALTESKAYTDELANGDVATLKTTVGDATSGLVKDVADLDTRIDALEAVEYATNADIDEMFTE